MTKYYLTGWTNCKTFEDAINVISRIPPEIPIGIEQYSDGEYCIFELDTKPRQHGQIAYQGKVILTHKD